MALSLVGISPWGVAQDARFSAYSELGGYAAGSSVPFWLRANQWGTVPLEAPFGTARLGMHYQSPRPSADTSRHTSRLSWSAGLEGVANLGSKHQYLLPEAYVKLRWKRWELMAGRERQIVGIVDTTLSSGSYSFSGNTLPIPMVRLGLSEYLPIGFLGNYLSIKGTFAHGWYDDPYIQDAFFHQKSLYGRLGKPEGKVHFQLGLVHHAVWGGAADYLRDSPWAVNGKLTTDFGDYVWGVVLGKIPKDRQNSRITIFESTNRVGNHVGHIDMALDWRIKNTAWLLYRQNPFEDASGLQFQNLPDGLYGLSVRRTATSESFFSLKGMALEFLSTMNQSGSTFDPAARFQGLDNYFNHAQYIRGWSYRGQGMGTPFLPIGEDIKENLRVNQEFFPSNQTKLFHAAVEGTLLGKVQLMAKFSSSLNFGTINEPFPSPIRQYSSLLALDAPLLRWGDTRIKAKIAYDNGGLYPQSLGGYLGIKSTFRKK